MKKHFIGKYRCAQILFVATVLSSLMIINMYKHITGK